MRLVACGLVLCSYGCCVFLVCGILVFGVLIWWWGFAHAVWLVFCCFLVFETWFRLIVIDFFDFLYDYFCVWVWGLAVCCLFAALIRG